MSWVADTASVCLIRRIHGLVERAPEIHHHLVQQSGDQGPVSCRECPTSAAAGSGTAAPPLTTVDGARKGLGAPFVQFVVLVLRGPKGHVCLSNERAGGGGTGNEEGCGNEAGF